MNDPQLYAKHAKTIAEAVEEMRRARRGEPVEITTPMCHHCGAAFTPHDTECPLFGEPPPALKPELPPVTPAEAPSVAAQAVEAKIELETIDDYYQGDLWYGYTMPLYPPEGD